MLFKETKKWCATLKKPNVPVKYDKVHKGLYAYFSETKLVEFLFALNKK